MKSRDLYTEREIILNNLWGSCGFGLGIFCRFFFYYLFVCFPEATFVIYSVPDSVYNFIPAIPSLFPCGTQVPTTLHRKTMHFLAASNFQVIS